MLVLVATTELQGRTPGDYFCTIEGELVTPVAVECGGSVRCGCNRGFPGLASNRACTTALVVDLPHVSPHDLRNAVYDYVVRNGWIDLLCDTYGADEVDEFVDDITNEHLEAIEQVCSRFPVGTVLSRSGTLVSARAFPAAA